ncbi:MAG: GxxExxY protein [Deltaproteobacteria bacterium]|nr:GxxExxY protein [Deltaproteobacteria bacterium]RLB89642.1 MAG: GxxExxY protein [Deltaproteobacteria bacterium]
MVHRGEHRDDKTVKQDYRSGHRRSNRSPPGLLESAYEACLAYELAQQGLAVEKQKALPLKYRNVKVDCGYRIDLLAEGKVIIEVKAVNTIHEAQLLSYLKLSGCKIGLLINFNVKVVKVLKNGVRRLVLGFQE